jgi:hypothetical protein
VQIIPLIALIRLGVIIAVIALMLVHGAILTGKSYVYADRGETALKGFEDTVQLYEVRWQVRTRPLLADRLEELRCGSQRGCSARASTPQDERKTGGGRGAGGLKPFATTVMRLLG